MKSTATEAIKAFLDAFEVEITLNDDGSNSDIHVQVIGNEDWGGSYTVGFEWDATGDDNWSKRARALRGLIEAVNGK